VIIASTSHQLTDVIGQCRRQARPIAMVPTMGALHRGHTSLFDVARRDSAFVIATIFVNPLQFSDPSDLESYPITLDADLELCRSHGVDAVYVPTAAVMYPQGFSTSVHIDGLTEILEGESRPGHFNGVTTVVTKLFNACQPDIAIFGQKDFQQAAVIRRLITDLDMPIELVIAPTMRDEDGLALSSRNVRLDGQSRILATNLWRGLSAALNQFAAGENRAHILIETVRDHCAAPGILLHYVAAVDTETLESKSQCDDHTVILLAATVGGVRLIDNVLLSFQ